MPKREIAAGEFRALPVVEKKYERTDKAGH